MKKFIGIAALTGVIMAQGVQAATDATSDIPIDRVILSTSGLANIEHRAKVKGDVNVEFPVRFEQVDDILKSLVIFDRAGKLGGVTLPGKQPLTQVFRDLPFSHGQLSSPMLLLNAYQGAVVSAKFAGGNVAGKVIQVVPEETIDKEGRAQTRHRLNLMTDSGMRQVLLEDLQSLQFSDPKVRAEIARALDAIRENGTAEKRVMNVSLLGGSTRDVRLSYVVDAPLWKSAYRMVIPESGDKGVLQGWAVIENMTASDWENVDLTLVSGNPVTFRQSLYESYYVTRPEIPVQVFGRVMPRSDKGTLATAAEMETDKSYAAKDRRADGRGMMKSMDAPMALMGRMAMADAAAPPMPAMEMQEMNYSGIDNMAQAASAAASSEATSQVLFRFPTRFDLGAGQSMMLPFAARDMKMEKLALYQPDTHATHPLSAVEIVNDGNSSLPPGVLTLYEESDMLKGTAFVGDASFPALAQGEKRMISYALDTKTAIHREDKSVTREDKISISQGVVRTSVVNRSEATYTIKAPPKENRRVVIEHPKMHGYDIKTPDPKTVEVTDTHYRIKADVKAGEKLVLPVTLENTAWQSYGIDGMPTDQLMAYATSRGNLDPNTRKSFETIAAMRRAMDVIDQQVYALDAERQTIFDDQARVRENLKSMDGKSDIQKRYLEKLEEQEERIQIIDDEKKKLAAERSRKETEMKELMLSIQF